METKSELRTKMLKLRDSISGREQKDAQIQDTLLSLSQFQSAETVAFYLSKGSEVNTKQMIEESIRQGKAILVPVTGHEIQFVHFTSFNDLAPAKFGVLEPKTRKIAANSPDVVITPGIAFDLDLHRLGYGRGYYDKLFKKINSKRIGICYDSQIVEKIPRHEHDQKLDAIVTEKRIISG